MANLNYKLNTFEDNVVISKTRTFFKYTLWDMYHTNNILATIFSDRVRNDETNNNKKKN